jgi:hypothetical protein
VVVPAAPRYDPRILDAVRALDDRGEPIAEVARRVAAAAEGFGLARPSYVHLRRIVHVERARQDADRERREAVRRALIQAGQGLLVGRFVNPYDVADRVADIRRLGPP